MSEGESTHQPKFGSEHETAESFAEYYRRVVSPNFDLAEKHPEHAPTDEYAALKKDFLLVVECGDAATPEERKALMRRYGELKIKEVQRANPNIVKS